jgi:hypothetical protein
VQKTFLAMCTVKTTKSLATRTAFGTSTCTERTPQSQRRRSAVVVFVEGEVNASNEHAWGASGERDGRDRHRARAIHHRRSRNRCPAEVEQRSQAMRHS